MILNFVINDEHLIHYLLRNIGAKNFPSRKYIKDIVAFQNLAWKKSKTLFDLFSGRLLIDDFENKKFLNESKNLSVFLTTLKKSREYKKIYTQTEKYLIFCKKQWEKNYEYSSAIIKELTKFNLNKNFTVFIVHPSIGKGRYLGNNKIEWGHHESWPNYATIYLWHEILHSYFSFSDKDHAIIQLISDNELRSRLNGNKYPPFEGHKELVPLMKKMLPKWKRYICLKERNFKKFYKSL